MGLSLSSCQNKGKEPPVAATPGGSQLAIGYNIGTVNYEDLIALHPEADELDEIDKAIALKRQKVAELQGKAIETLQREGSNKMRSAVETARAKLEGERSAIESEMAALSSTMSAQMEGELKGIQAKMQRDLDRDVQAYKASSGVKEGPAPTSPEKLPANIEGQVSDYLQNLSMVRERNLAARRLELEKAVSDTVNAKKAEVDSQLASYEAQLAAGYQNERLNLQLSAQNSTDEATKTAAEERLSAISADIEAKRSAKRKELEAGYSALRAEKTAAMQNELEAYHNKLNGEVAQKVAEKRRELGFAAPQPQAQAHHAPSGPPPEIQAKIDEMQARMRSEFEARKAELSARMQTKSAEARERLNQKQTQVEAELKTVEAQIASEVAKRIKELAPETNKALETIKKEIANLEEQRVTLAKKIASDISQSVEGVAQKKHVDMVIGLMPQGEFSTYPDVTELSKVAVQMEKSK